MQKHHRFAIPGLVLAASGLFWSGSAAASESFPSRVRDHLEMACTPKCTLCHTTDPGQAGSAEQDFAFAMVEAGLIPGDEESIGPALDALAASGTDTDGDGVGDVAELQTSEDAPEADPEAETASGSVDARDPNVPGAGDICLLEVRYGCGAHIASEPRSDAPLLFAGLVGLLFFAARRLRTHRV